MPLDGYRSRPPDEPPPPSSRFEIDEISWALLCMTAFASLRILLGLIRQEGVSTDVARAISVALPTFIAAIYRIIRSRPDDPV